MKHVFILLPFAVNYCVCDGVILESLVVYCHFFCVFPVMLLVVINSRRKRWAIRQEDEKCVHRFSHEERLPWRPRHILQDNIKTLKKCGLVIWSGFIWLLSERSGGLCEHSNEPSGHIKCI